MNGDGVNISSGIQKGDAQVFQPTQTDYLAKIGEMKYRQGQERKKRQAELTAGLDELDKIDIFYKHQPIFKKKQDEIYGYVKQNIDALTKGDPDKIMEFQELKQNFYNDANLSKTIKNNYKTAATMIAKDPWKYRGNTQQYLNDFTGYDETTGQFQDIDPLQFKENVDYSEHVLNDLSKVAERKAKRPEWKGWSDKEGAYVETGGDVFKKEQAYSLIKEDVLNNPQYLDQAAYEFGQLSKEEQNMYKTPADYFASIHSDALLINAPTYKVSPLPGGGSDHYTDDDYFKGEKKFNLGTEEDGVSVTSFGSIPHKQGYKVNISTGPDWIDKTTGVKVKRGANVNIVLGETINVPVYKSGAKKGQLIPDSEIQKAKADKTLEIKTMVTGLSEEKDEYGKIVQKSSLIPVEDVKNTLETRGVPYGTMKSEADKLNQQLGGGSRTVVKKFQNKTAKKTKFVYSDGTEEIVDGLK